MADDPRGGRGYPPRENPDEQKYPSQPEHDDRRAHPPSAGTSSTMPLPSAHYPPVAGGYPSEPRYPDSRYSSGQRHPSDQRYPDSRTWPEEPPTNHNGYSAPPPSRTEPLPPIQYPEDRPRFEPTRPPPPPGYDERRPHNDRRMPYEERGRYGDRYPEPYYPPPPAAGGPYGPAQDPYYRYPPGQPYPSYNDYARAGHNAPPPTAPPQQQAAPRQRTSIACRYCRKRKIRCSGYANTTNGKCANCDKLRIDCIFQPVSSNSTTAFVPVSAVPGGVPPGTQLYGAYGQPISGPGQPPQPPQQPGQQQRSYPPGPPSDYAPSLHSPVSQYNPSYDDRDRDTSRRRPRPSDDEPVMRLPPPNYPPDEDPRRRSPASAQSNGTPPTLYDQYHSAGSYEQDRTRTPQRNSPGGPPPTSAPPSQTQPSSQPFGARNPMSLTHLIRPESEIRAPSRDIDMSMKSKLDSRRS